MALTVNLIGDPAQKLEEARDRLMADGQPAEINAPVADTQLVVVCVSLDEGPTQPLVDLLRQAEGKPMRLGALLFTGGDGSDLDYDLVEMIGLEVRNLMSAALGKHAVKGLRKLKLFKKNWPKKLSKEVAAPPEPDEVLPLDKKRLKKFGLKGMFK